MQRIIYSLVCVCFASAVSAECSEEIVDLRWAGGSSSFTVEVADDAQERGVGLMNRESMANSSGMLFVWEDEQSVAFWMKNTLIPLDMLFFDKSGVLQKVHHNAQPHDETTIPGGDNIQYVLEINGGLARAYGIRAGAELKHPSIDEEFASWACSTQ